MAINRPTFSESWYRVSDLRPRLRSTVQITRQHFRGRMWHVVQDPGSNQFFRLSESAYYFVALLDGQRSVSEVWKICNEKLGDDAPTQGEAIQLLGQLYTSNLLQAEVTPDTQGLFNRYHKRVKREVQGYLTNLLFARIPIFDPDRFLDRWVNVFGWLFSPIGAVLWFIVVGIGLYSVLGRFDELYEQSRQMLDPDKLPLLYLSFILVKIIHEFGHGFSCKRFGLRSGGGEVHTLGIMLLVFMPLPYVDASSAWAFRSKWQRVIVGAGGMIIELMVASVAAVVWAHVGDGTLKIIMYNTMFIASVSTLLFNANPLLRYDGYYILSDLLEIPNLAQRSRSYLMYIVRRYIYGVRNPQNPAHTPGEKVWFSFYGIASTAYRLFILFAIVLFLSDRLPEQFKMLAIGMGFVCGALWFCMPVGKFIKYLATNGELMRTRTRAVIISMVVIFSVIAAVALIPMPDRFRAEGIVEPTHIQFVHAHGDGYILNYAPSGIDVSPDGQALINTIPQGMDKQKFWEQANPKLAAARVSIAAEVAKLQAKYRYAMNENKLAVAQAFTEQVQATKDQLARVESDLEQLTVKASFAGKWVSPDIDKYDGQYVQKGTPVGLLATMDDLIVRATSRQETGQILIAMRKKGESISVEIRVKGRPGQKFNGVIREILPAGLTKLPSASLGYPAGGSMEVDLQDREGVSAKGEFFEFRVKAEDYGRLLPGQRVVVRFDASAKPKLYQWYRGLLQLLQKKR